MISKHLFSIFFAAVVFTCAGCLDEITLDTGTRPGDGIVIQGVVYAGDQPEVSVRVERAFQFEGSNLPDRVPGATVVVSNTLGEELNLRYNTSVGIYEPAGGDLAGFTLQPGLSYELRVSLPDGRRIVSQAALMLETPQPSELRYTAAQLETASLLGGTRLADGFTIEIDTPLELPGTSEKTRLRWQTFESYIFTEAPTHPNFRDNEPRICYITDREVGSEQVKFIDGTEVTVGTLENFQLASVLLSDKHREGYVLTAVQEALPEDVYVYFSQIAESITREASLFEPPPGIIQNNLTFEASDERVYGFFYASERKIIRVYIEPQVGVTARCPRPPSQSPFPMPNQCDDCVQFGGAQLEKPSYFP